MEPENLDFINTCYCSPEQYDVYADNCELPIGYVRLRWGAIRAEYRGNTVYTNSYSSEEADGMFFSDELREKELGKIAKRIAEAYNKDCSF